MFSNICGYVRVCKSIDHMATLSSILNNAFVRRNNTLHSITIPTGVTNCCGENCETNRRFFSSSSRRNTLLRSCKYCRVDKIRISLNAETMFRLH